MDPSDQTQDRGKYTLPADFLSGPAQGLIVQRIDFSKTSLPEYDGLYATIIDNALSETECNSLIRAAEAHSGGKWEQAMVNVGGGRQRLISDVRDCGRIIWDDDVVVGKIWSRISSLVPELETIETAARVTGQGPLKRGEKYQMTRLNERMRFLKYGSGQYFRRKPAQLLFSSLTLPIPPPPQISSPHPHPHPHPPPSFPHPSTQKTLFPPTPPPLQTPTNPAPFSLFPSPTAHEDGMYITPNGLERSFYTLHLYLNESNPHAPEGPLQGGATTFHSYNMERRLDVLPKIGRVLLFQHRHLLHSGDDVTAGIKVTMRTDLMFKKV